MDFSRFFIDRPIFAAVLSILIFITGLIAIPLLPVSEYPDVVPPSVQVRAEYPGANPKVIAETVATPLEEAINGVENMMYMKSVAGSDGVLVPILMLVPGLVEEGVKVYGLVGEATYSSAIINAVELVDAGGVLAGSPTSGSVNHFGSTGSFTLSNSGIRVSCSSKYIDLGTLLEAGPGAQVEPLVPTVLVEQTLDGYLAGRDTLVDWLLANGADYTAPEQPDAPLTRGRLAWMLWQAAGAPEAEPAPFSDLMPFAYYAPGVGWCDQTGIANGVPGGAFRASCAVTLEEAAQMLVRFVRQQGLTPAEVRSGAPVLASDPAPWASESVAQAWRWGLVAEGADPTGVLTRAQGEALLARLAP